MINETIHSGLTPESKEKASGDDLPILKIEQAILDDGYPEMPVDEKNRLNALFVTAIASLEKVARSTRRPSRGKETIETKTRRESAHRAAAKLIANATTTALSRGITLYGSEMSQRVERNLNLSKPENFKSALENVNTNLSKLYRLLKSADRSTINSLNSQEINRQLLEASVVLSSTMSDRTGTTTNSTWINCANAFHNCVYYAVGYGFELDIGRGIKPPEPVVKIISTEPVRAQATPQADVQTAPKVSVENDIDVAQYTSANGCYVLNGSEMWVDNPQAFAFVKHLPPEAVQAMKLNVQADRTLIYFPYAAKFKSVVNSETTYVNGAIHNGPHFTDALLKGRYYHLQNSDRILVTFDTGSQKAQTSVLELSKADFKKLIFQINSGAWPQALRDFAARNGIDLTSTTSVQTTPDVVTVPKIVTKKSEPLSRPEVAKEVGRTTLEELQQRFISWWNRPRTQSRRQSKSAQPVVTPQRVEPPRANEVAPGRILRQGVSETIGNYRDSMEDAHQYIDNFMGDRNKSFMAIYDGHGGSKVAEYARDNLHNRLHKYLLQGKSVEQAMRQAFIEIDKEVDIHWQQGATAAVVYRDGETLYSANAGDARTVICEGGTAVQISKDHKAADQAEQQRVRKMGGSVRQDEHGHYRINGLAVARALGDSYNEYVSPDPEINRFELTKNSEFAIVACDGLWDVMKNQEAVDAVKYYQQEGDSDPESISNKLVRLALTKGSTDNISVMVVFLK